MKIAIFKNIEYEFESVSGESSEGREGYVRITEYIDVEFERLEDKEIVEKQVDCLREVKKKIQAETEVKIGEVDRRIGELLSLPQGI
jgi:hypothetical protein